MIAGSFYRVSVLRGAARVGSYPCMPGTDVPFLSPPNQACVRVHLSGHAPRDRYIGMDAETHRFHEEWVRLPTGRHFSVIAELDAEHNHGDDGGAAVAAAAVKAVEEADGGGDADASGGVSAEDVTVGTSGAGAGLLDNAAPAGVTEEGHADATATADDTGAAAASTTHAEGGSAAASADDSTGASVEDADGGGPHKVHVHKPAHTDAV